MGAHDPLSNHVPSGLGWPGTWVLGRLLRPEFEESTQGSPNPSQPKPPSTPKERNPVGTWFPSWDSVWTWYPSWVWVRTWVPDQKVLRTPNGTLTNVGVRIGGTRCKVSIGRSLGLQDRPHIRHYISMELLRICMRFGGAPEAAPPLDALGAPGSTFTKTHNLKGRNVSVNDQWSWSIQSSSHEQTCSFLQGSTSKLWKKAGLVLLDDV